MDDNLDKDPTVTAGTTNAHPHNPPDDDVDDELVTQVAELIQLLLKEAAKACQENTMKQALILIDHRRRIGLLESRILSVRGELLRCAEAMREVENQLQARRQEYSPDELHLAKEFLSMFTRCLRWADIHP